MRYALCLLILISSLGQAFAAPSISSVSGTVSNGNSITISGSDFETKSPASPIVASFNDSTAANNFSNGGTWPIGDWEQSQGSCFLTNSGVRHGYTQGSYVLSCTADGSTGGYDKLNYTHNVAEDNLFVSFQINKNTDWSTVSPPNNSKFLRIYQASTNDGNLWYTDRQGTGTIDVTEFSGDHIGDSASEVLAYSSDWNAGGCTVVSEYGASYLHLASNGTCESNYDSTYEHWEVFLDYPSTRGGYDTIAIVWNDGATVGRVTGATFDQSGHSNTQRQILIGAVTAGGHSSAPEYLVDSVYIDNTQAHVFISDSSTLTWPDIADFHVKEIQVASAWSNTSITVTVNQGEHTGTKYLYVVNDSGEINTTGYEVTFGAGDTTPPTVASASIGTDGTTVTVNFSETVVTTGYDNGDFDLDCTSAGNGISLNSISGSGSSRTLTAATTINSGDTCNLDYTGGADEIEDTAGNDLATFSDTAVTNNSTINPSPQQSGVTFRNVGRK